MIGQLLIAEDNRLVCDRIQEAAVMRHNNDSLTLRLFR